MVRPRLAASLKRTLPSRLLIRLITAPTINATASEIEAASVGHRILERWGFFHDVSMSRAGDLRAEATDWMRWVSGWASHSISPVHDTGWACSTHRAAPREKSVHHVAREGEGAPPPPAEPGLKQLRTAPGSRELEEVGGAAAPLGRGGARASPGSGLVVIGVISSPDKFERRRR